MLEATKDRVAELNCSMAEVDIGETVIDHGREAMSDEGASLPDKEFPVDFMGMPGPA